jgi:hypothetical protein
MTKSNCASGRCESVTKSDFIGDKSKNTGNSTQLPIPQKNYSETLLLPPDDYDDGNVITCIGLISSTGNEISIFDARGNLQSFSYTGGGNNTISDYSLCFSTHGHNNADDLLTPCFDQEGLHGDPEETCFCGIDTPHLHAHIHDPKNCGQATNSVGGGSLESQLMLLARLILHPIPTTKVQLLILHDDEYPSKPFQCCNANDYTPVEQESASVSCEIKVAHGDHYDWLVYNPETSALHQEHTCDECGGRAGHGTFELIDRRRWRVDQNILQLNVYDQSRRQQSGSQEIKQGDCTKNDCCRNDYYCSQPPKTGDCCQKDVCGHANCVAEAIEEKSACCSVDVHAEKSDCCAKNLTEQQLYHCSGDLCTKGDSTGYTVQLTSVPALKHEESDSLTCCSDESVCSKPCCATGICTRKVNERLKRKIGRSRFYVDKICCASEIPAIRSIVEPIDGVDGIMINVTTKMASE